MALSDTQVRQLRAKLEAKHVKTRNAHGTNLHYVEGWHVIAEANRIFGYDAWDRRTLASHCVWSGASGAYHAAAYTAKVRVSVRAGDITIVREGSGTGEGKALPGQAHELALKGAETDATKRALATFGNPFGLALYDREQVGVRKARSEKASPPIGPWILRSVSGKEKASFAQPSEFAGALRKAMAEARDIELLFAIWEQNVETVRALNRSLKQEQLPQSGIAPQLVNHLKQCAIALVKPGHRMEWRVRGRRNNPRSTSLRSSQDGQERPNHRFISRIRCKEHLRFVASQPCLICGRYPSHAHHVRYAQSRGLSLKVSDEFTVPLCAIHHHHVHTTGKEKEWWQERNIDPLKVASGLWQQSRQEYPAAAEADLPEIDGGSKCAQGSNYGSKSIVAAGSTPDSTDSINHEP